MLRGRLITVAAVLFGLLGTAEARADTLAYDTTTRVVTITLTVTAPYVEIGADSGGDYFINNANGFSTTPGGCTVSGTQYKCGSPASRVTKTIVTGTPGVDTVLGLTHLNQTLSDYNPPIEMDLGSGNDVVQAGDGNDIINLGDGSDSATNYFGNDVINGGAGADHLIGGKNADALDGGPGSDALDGGEGNDSLDGQDDSDSLGGGPGNDDLHGGAGRDVLIGGPGADGLSGGDGLDTVSYDERTTGVSVSLDGQANDGEPGEGDLVGADNEIIATGSGPDQVTGDSSTNDIDTGPGDDTVNIRDGVFDHIDCGDGVDTVVGDQLDAVLNCENLQLSRDLQPDVDNDGIAAPADCDDRNAARRPGLPDTPGNGVDEDCSGADAAPSRVAAVLVPRFKTSKGKTAVKTFTVYALPTGASVELRCSGGKPKGCFSGIRRRAFAKGADHAELASLLKGKLKSGAVLEVRVLVAGQIGRVVSYTMQAKRKSPKALAQCLPPGAAKPTRC